MWYNLVMENKKAFYIKLPISIVFGMLVFVMYLYVNIADDIMIGDSWDILGYTSVIACFVLSLIFIRLDKKKLLITLALGTNVIADYFLVLHPYYENQLPGVSLFCVVHFFYFLYTIFLNKELWQKIVNVSVRVVLCIIMYFVTTHFLELSIVEIISVMYIINSAVTVFTLAFYIKKEYLLFVGLLLLMMCDIFVGIMWGGGEMLGMSYGFIDFINHYDFAFICYIPAEFLIAMSSVWAKKQLSKKPLVIAGFAGIGKTTLSKKYKDVIDIESSPYRYDYSGVLPDEYESLKGKKDKAKNADFPTNYIKAIKKAQKTHKIVFVFLDAKLLEEYEKAGIDYVICYPDEDALKKYYLERFTSRGNSLEFAKNTLDWWHACVNSLEGNTHQKIILHGDETIEDYLLKNGYLLENKINE